MWDSCYKAQLQLVRLHKWAKDAAELQNEWLEGGELHQWEQTPHRLPELGTEEHLLQIASRH